MWLVLLRWFVVKLRTGSCFACFVCNLCLQGLHYSHNFVAWSTRNQENLRANFTIFSVSFVSSVVVSLEVEIKIYIVEVMCRLLPLTYQYIGC